MIRQFFGQGHDIGERSQRPHHIGLGHWKGFEGGEMQAARLSRPPPEGQSHQQIQTRAKPQFCDMEVRPKAVRQAVALQEHICCLGHAVLDRKIGIVELAGHWDCAIAPIQLGSILALHGKIL